MKDVDFAFAVAKVRVKENSLLSFSDCERLCSFRSEKDALGFLAEKGYNTEIPMAEMLKEAERELVAFTEEISPDRFLMNYIFIRNDFHNLKNALKDLVTAFDNSAGYGPDGTVKCEVIRKAVSNKDFSSLPSFLAARAETAYDILVKSYDGQSADIFLDRESLAETIAEAERSDSALALKIAKAECTAANIKIAFRAVLTGKDSRFLENALCGGGELSVAELKGACAKGLDALAEFLTANGFADIAESMKISAADFEKSCDNRITDCIGAAKFKSFGADPIIAYYYAKKTEIKNIRIILSCLKTGVPEQEIKQRVRRMYV